MHSWRALVCDSTVAARCRCGSCAALYVLNKCEEKEQRAQFLGSEHMNEPSEKKNVYYINKLSESFVLCFTLHFFPSTHRRLVCAKSVQSFSNKFPLVKHTHTPKVALAPPYDEFMNFYDGKSSGAKLK